MFWKDGSLTFYISSNVQREAGESPWLYNQIKASLLLRAWKVWWLWQEVSILNEYVHISVISEWNRQTFPEASSASNQGIWNISI